MYLFWKRCKEQMFQRLKDIGEAIVISGDGRHDSMGHSAKYCAYTVFANTIPLIIEFSLAQVKLSSIEPRLLTLQSWQLFARQDVLNNCTYGV